MAACASSSTPSIEPTLNSCAEANQPNTQSPIPPSGVVPPQTQTETQQATINGGKEPSKIWDHFSRIEGCDPFTLSPSATIVKRVIIVTQKEMEPLPCGLI